MSAIRPTSSSINVSGCALYLLGSIRLCTEATGFIDQSCWASHQQQAIFVYLVLNREHIVSPAELQRQFWPYLTNDAVAEEVTAVSQTLGNILNLPNPILHLEDGYQLRAAIPLWVDIDEFDTLLAQAAAEPTADRQRQLLQQAVNLYQDDFLHDLPLNQKWIIAWRAHFQQGYLAALQNLSALYEQAGDLETAQKIYLNALKAKPITAEHGRSFLHLVQDHSSSAQTLRQCQRLIALLQTELEILLEDYTQPLAASDSPEDKIQERGKG